jgi:hypothetical protein
VPNISQLLQPETCMRFHRWVPCYRNIPQSLLLLSRAFKITTAASTRTKKQEDASTETVEALRNTFNLLPEETIKGVEMERFKCDASLQKRLEYVQQVEQDILDENATELSSAREALQVWAWLCFQLCCDRAVLHAPCFPDIKPWLHGSLSRTQNCTLPTHWL